MIVVALLAAWSSIVGPTGLTLPESSSQRRAGECLLAIDRQDIQKFADADNAMRLDVNDTVRIDVLSSEPTSVTRILVDVPIGPSIPVQTFRHQPSELFTEVLRIADISDIGVGWYHIEVRSGPCSGAFWVRVYGRSPLTTAIGVGATVVFALGVGLVIDARVRARRGQSSPWWGAAAGLLVGIAVCVLAQQFAIVALTAGALAVFLGAGAGAGAGATAVGSAGAGGAAVGSPPPALPPPAPPPPAPSPSAPVPSHAPDTSGGFPPPQPGGAEPTADPPQRA